MAIDTAYAGRGNELRLSAFSAILVVAALLHGSNRAGKVGKPVVVGGDVHPSISRRVIAARAFVLFTDVKTDADVDAFCLSRAATLRALYELVAVIHAARTVSVG
nr:hypothetical protein [Brucella intermedia]